MPVITAKGKWDSGRVLFWAGSHGQGTEEARMFMAERAKNEGHFTDWFTPAGWYVIKDRWKLLSPGTGTLKLYDIKNDPGENTDLASKYPQTVKEMSILFNEWLKDKPGPTGWDRSKWKLMKQLAEKYAALPGSDT
jgi:arylsulfatase A-like enzyme